MSYNVLCTFKMSCSCLRTECTSSFRSHLNSSSYKTEDSEFGGRGDPSGIYYTCNGSESYMLSEVCAPSTGWAFPGQEVTGGVTGGLQISNQFGLLQCI